MKGGQKFWEAVLSRDKRFDGRFVYAVRSTGIYCRPTCPSRRPGRPQVVFFLAGIEAEKAGFRPCRRCRPQDPISTNWRLVQQVCAYIQENHTQPLKLADLSRH